MNLDASKQIEFDWHAFHPWRVQPVRHHLSGHPLLEPDQLVEFGKRLDKTEQLYTFNNGATASANFNEVSQSHPNHRSPEETLRHIRDAKAWMLLRHVQADPAYRRMIDSALDDIKPQVERKDPGMCYRAGWIFVSSPHTITPFHIDRNHGILLQIRGTKTVYVWEPDDIVAVSHRARDRFHGHRSLDLVEWREELRSRAHVLRLSPGMGVYMPLTSPHMVETSDEPSITLSLSYNTTASRRNSLLHVVRDRMHGFGIELPSISRYPMLDASCYASARALLGARQLMARLVGRSPTSDGAPYAVA